MIVKQILKLKADGAVHTIAPDATLADAAQELAARRIGVLIVSGDGQAVAGIVSERDIVRELGRRGAVCLSDTVETIMTRSVVSCSPGDGADDVLEKMSAGRFRHMPVIDEGKLVAMVSQGDVVKAKLAELAMEKDALQGMIMGH
ncbi:MAG: CBS domain-containing protein [Rhodobacteraceae bacterium]|nr:CBS domain-containing protein [Paracoccaceae bacterium]